MRYCRPIVPFRRVAPGLLATAVLLLAPLPGWTGEAAMNASASRAPSGYEQEVEAWRRERIADLKKEGGWLSLVGLFWLDEGENRFGSAASNKVIFPEGSAPAVAGTFERHGTAVTVHAAPGIPLTHDGKPVTDLALTGNPGPPVELALGSLRFFIIQRGDRVGVRVKDLQSPAMAAFRGIDSYPVRPEWRVEAHFERYDPPKKIAVPNILGQVEDNPSPGAAVFERDGKTYRLDVIDQGKDGSLFFVFGDRTNGRETYGGGRFLDAPPPKDGKVVIDFNEAYNPPCAFTAFATCPLPPPQNKLAVGVEAGEKKYGEGHH
jgi:uncharacterized protein